MKIDLEIKKLVFHQLVNLIEEKIENSSSALLSIKESRDSATKSSAGDKHETGRAMMQLELEKLEVQLNHALIQKKDLEKFDPKIIHEKVEFGSLVLSNQGNYFVSIGIGNMEIEGMKYFAISLASPIGQLINNRKVGDLIHFRGTDIKIEKII